MGRYRGAFWWVVRVVVGGWLLVGRREGGWWIDGGLMLRLSRRLRIFNSSANSKPSEL